MDNTFASWMLGLCAVLIAAGVVGLFKLGISVSSLQATVAAWSRIFEDRFIVITSKTDEHEKRIGFLEGQAKVNRVLIDRLNNSGNEKNTIP